LKKTLLIYLLFSFIISGLNHIYPILDYLINKEEIIEKHCQNKDKPVMKCNGKCHLKKQVSKKIKVEKTSSNHPFNLPIKPFENFNAYCNEICELEKKIQSYSTHTSTKFIYIKFLSFLESSIDIPPPKFS
tara:strand:+ start:2532 stop:2924 length:393 start_codon:yes stop_codon:yes gene_type:complete